MKQETRYHVAKGEIRTLETRSDGMVRIGGRAVPYRVEADLFAGRVFEQFERGSIPPETRAEARQMAHHDRATVMASAAKGTMEFQDGDAGLDYESTLDVDRNMYARTLVSQIERGEIEQSSIGFGLGKGYKESRTERDDGTTLITVERVALLREVSAVPFAAYGDSTSVGVRSIDEYLAARAKEEEELLRTKESDTVVPEVRLAPASLRARARARSLSMRANAR